MNKEKRCVFCEWERLYKEKENYNWDYVCPRCCKLCGVVDKFMLLKDKEIPSCYKYKFPKELTCP